MDWWFTLVFLVLGFLFLIVIFSLSKLLSKKKPSALKLSTYENGEEAVGANTYSFNPKYLMIAIMFILFEVEILLLFPWALAYFEISDNWLAWKLFAIAEFSIFIFLLSLGLFYAWKLGVFNWGVVKNNLKVHNEIPEVYKKYNQKYIHE